MLEPNTANEPPQARVSVAQREAKPLSVNRNRWRLDSNVSWYGPGFYGKRTACGLAMTETLIGVAHRTLPCGTKITFRNPANGRTVTAPVVDRGPYVTGRQWDLTGWPAMVSAPLAASVTMPGSTLSVPTNEATNAVDGKL